MKSRKGKDNPNYKHGKHVNSNFCVDCSAKIDPRSIRCTKCANSGDNNPFKGKKHKKKTLKKISKASKKKFTKEYVDSIKSKSQGNKKRAINGYILIKDYNHPNRNCHNDILEHIKVMSEMLCRPLTKGEIVHHINFIRDDNRKKNLYLYNGIAEHNRCSRTIFNLVDTLLKQKIIVFKNGEYKMHKNYKTGGSSAVVGGAI